MSKKKQAKRARTERRFVPKAKTNPTVVYVVGGIGGIMLGAGVWGQFGSYVRADALEPFKYAPWILAAGAILLGIAIWIGTSSEAAIRIGQAGLAVERGGVRRMAWWRVESLTGDPEALVVTGKDESGDDLTVRVDRVSLPGAMPWLAKEARARIPEHVDLSEETLGAIGAPSKDQGEVLDCPPLQLVGRRCAETDKIIAFEPDARVCPRCERVYQKASVPKTCACGASLAGLREKRA